MAFGTKKTVQFASRMSSIKNMFKVAHEDASKLKTEMEKDIEDINTTKAEAEAFIENISKFI